MPKKVFKGKVISNKMNKTVVVGVSMPKRHKVYNKLIKRVTKLKARDDLGVNLGDTVLIKEVVPYSKTVAWKVVENLSAKEKK